MESQSRIFARRGRSLVNARAWWEKVPDDLRRTAVKNLELAGISRSAAMAIVGHRSESIYQGFALADGSLLRESMEKLAAFHQREKSNSVRNVRAPTERHP